MLTEDVCEKTLPCCDFVGHGNNLDSACGFVRSACVCISGFRECVAIEEEKEDPETQKANGIKRPPRQTQTEASLGMLPAIQL